MHGTVLITGSDNGLGLLLAKRYAECEWNVLATMHDTSVNQLRGLPSVRVVEMDLSDQNAITNAAVRLSGEPIDLLVHGASLLVRDGLEELSDHDFSAQLQVNCVAPFLVSRALLPNLRLAVEKHGIAKVVAMGSHKGTLEDAMTGGLYGYRASKAALHAVSASLAADLKHERIAMVVVDPSTSSLHDETQQLGQGEECASIHALMELIDTIRMDKSGSFLATDGSPLPW